MDILLLYVTTPTQEMAALIGRTLVEEGLAACANILPGMQSIYRWQGKIETASETVLLVKTTAGAYPHAEARIKTLHSYDVPCIVALPMTAAEPAFATWIREQVQPL